MRNYPNIEASGFHPGQYVGIAHGPWRIRKAGRGWYVQPMDNCGFRYKVSPFNVDTLREASMILESFQMTPPPRPFSFGQMTFDVASSRWAIRPISSESGELEDEALSGLL